MTRHEQQNAFAIAITRKFAAEYGTTPAGLRGPKRVRYTVEPRWRAMAALRAHDPVFWTHKEIGIFFGGRDPSSVSYALKQVAKMEATE